MTLRRAMTIGALLGVTFSLAAAIADVIITDRLPHPHVYADLNEYLATIRK